MSYIENEINSAPNESNKSINQRESVRTFQSEIEQNKIIKSKFMDVKTNVVPLSTRLAIFLGVEDNFNINVPF